MQGTTKGTAKQSDIVHSRKVGPAGLVFHTKNFKPEIDLQAAIVWGPVNSDAPTLLYQRGSKSRVVTEVPTCGNHLNTRGEPSCFDTRPLVPSRFS